MHVLTAGKGVVMMATGASNTLYSGRAAPVSMRFFYAFLFYGWGAAVRKAAGMSVHMFEHPIHLSPFKSVMVVYKLVQEGMNMSNISAPIRALSFNQTRFNMIDRDGQLWLTSSEIAQALGYVSEKSISNLYARNKDEFTTSMSEVIELMTSGNYQKSVRIFSLRGAHLIGMFARTAIAKDFRKWVLDVLEHEGQAGGAVPLLPDCGVSPVWSRVEVSQMNLTSLCSCMVMLAGFWHQYGGVFEVLNGRVASSVNGFVQDGAFNVRLLAQEHQLDVPDVVYARGFPFDGEYEAQKRYFVERGKRKACLVVETCVKTRGVVDE